MGLSRISSIGRGTPAPSGKNVAILPTGGEAFVTPGTYTWTAPTGVLAVSVVCVGGGGGGRGSNNFGYYGGGGGGLGWINNYSVTPGESYTVVVGSGGAVEVDGGSSYFVSSSIVAGFGGISGQTTGAGGGYAGAGGGIGGNGGAIIESGGGGGGGGGAGGYSGNGGNGGPGGNNSGGLGGSGASGTGGGGSGGSGGNDGQPANSGGGVGIFGLNISGGAGSVYGGGGGGGGDVGNGATAGSGGAVRIIWGNNRGFPSNNTGGPDPLPPPPVYYYLGGAIDPATAESPNQNGWTVNTTDSFTLQNSISAVVPGVEDNPVYNTFVGRPVFFQLPWELDIVNTGGLTLEWWQRVPSGSTNVERVTSWMLSQNSPLLKYTQEFDAALGQRISVITYNNTYPGIIAVNNASLLGAGNAPIENAWQHFAVTLASNGQTMTLWVNGVLGVQNTFTGATPAAATKFNYLSILNANCTTIENAQNLNRLVSRVRLRTGVRYTTTFTPSNTLDPDSSTIFFTQFDQYQAGTVLTNSAVQKVGTNQTVSAYSTPHDFMWKSLRIPSRSATYFCVAYKSSSLIQTRVYEVKDSTPNTVTLVFTGTGLNWGTRSNFDLVAFPGTGQPKTYNSNLVTDGYFVLLFRSNINGLSYTIRLDHLSGVLTITGTTENSFNQYITSTTYLSHRNQLFTVSTQDLGNENTSLTAHLHDIVLDNTTAKGYTFSQVSSANYTGYSVYLTTGTNYFAFTLSDDRVSDLQVLVYTTTGGSVLANVFYLDPQTDAISRGTLFVNTASIPFGSQPYNQLALSKLGNRVLLAPKTSGTPYNTQTPLRGLTITNNTPTITNDSTNLLYDKNVVGAAWVGSDRVIAFQLAPDVNPNKRVTSLRLFPDTWSTATQLETALPADFTESDVPPVNVERIGNTLYALIMNTSTSFAIYKIELQF